MKTSVHDTLDRVKEALTKSGYGTEGILSAHFKGWNDSDEEVHHITFEDIEQTSGIGIGHVYIDKDGKGEF